MQFTGRKQQVAEELARVRHKTLWLLRQVPTNFWNVRVHDFYSPIGWHFGHIGMTEEYWTCDRALGRAPHDQRLSFLFANIPENPKDNRVHLPNCDQVEAYLRVTRDHTLAALEEASIDSDDPLLADAYAWEFAVQHECQHQETIVEMLQLIRQQEAAQFTVPERSNAAPEARSADASPTAVGSSMVHVAGGSFVMGSDDRNGYDNEKPAHVVKVAPFEMDVGPITTADWLRFMAAGGYRRSRRWSKAGWQWRTTHAVDRPEYWLPVGSGYCYCAVDGLRDLDPAEPVTSISWYEADAYARWAGKRLPTEAEWEFAAAYDLTSHRPRRYPWGDDPTGANAVDCEIRAWRPTAPPARPDASALGLRGMAGGAWEWTSSAFLPYDGFEAFPYDGYSKEHMAGNHFVCRGGSWATDRRILRASFRNWYVPTYRQGLLGMRCAR